MEDVLVGVHVQGVDVEVVRREVQALKHLAQGEVLAVPAVDNEGAKPVQVTRLRPPHARAECLLV